MAEYKAHGLGPIQKPLLVLHNQIIGINIVRGTLLLIGELTVYDMALLIDAEIPGVGRLRLDAIQIADIIILADSYLQVADDFVVFFLEHPGEWARDSLSRCIILAVICNLVDEEKGQYLDSLGE